MAKCEDCGRINENLTKVEGCAGSHLYGYPCCFKLVCSDYCLYKCDKCGKHNKDDIKYDGWRTPIECECGNRFKPHIKWHGYSIGKKCEVFSCDCGGDYKNNLDYLFDKEISNNK